jgi:hypothetical protein
MKKLFLIMAVVFATFLGKAQDTIVLNNGAYILGSVLQARSDSILYLLNNSSSKPFAIASDKVKNIRFGDTRIVNNGLLIPSNVDTLGPFKNSIKLGFLAPAFGHIYFSWEHALKNSMTLDVYLGGILDNSNSYYYYGDESYGGYLRVGLRFYLNNYVKRQGRKQYSPLVGQYFSALMSHTFWQYRTHYYYDYIGGYNDYSSLSHAYSGSIHWLYGIQIPISKHFVFNGSAGLGYSLTKYYGSSPDNGFEYSHAKPFNSSFSLTGMLQFGYIF